MQLAVFDREAKDGQIVTDWIDFGILRFVEKPTFTSGSEWIPQKGEPAIDQDRTTSTPPLSRRAGWGGGDRLADRCQRLLPGGQAHPLLLTDLSPRTTASTSTASGPVRPCASVRSPIVPRRAPIEPATWPPRAHDRGGRYRELVLSLLERQADRRRACGSRRCAPGRDGPARGSFGRSDGGHLGRLRDDRGQRDARDRPDLRRCLWARDRRRSPGHRGHSRRHHRPDHRRHWGRRTWAVSRI
jgi:hypothetical protein